MKLLDQTQRHSFLFFGKGVAVTAIEGKAWRFFEVLWGDGGADTHSLASSMRLVSGRNSNFPNTATNGVSDVKEVLLMVKDCSARRAFETVLSNALESTCGRQIRTKVHHLCLSAWIH